MSGALLARAQAGKPLVWSTGQHAPPRPDWSVQHLVHTTAPGPSGPALAVETHAAVGRVRITRRYTA